MIDKLKSDSADTCNPRRRPLRVLLVVEAAEGGTARHVSDLVQGLDRQRFALDVAYSTRRGPWFAKALHDAGRPLGLSQGLPLARAVAPATDARCLAALTGIMRRGRYDVVHCHSTKAGLLGRPAARAAGVPRVIYTPHGWAFWDRVGAARSAIETVERQLASITDILVAVSPREAELAEKARIEPRSKLVIIPNGIDADAVTNDAGDSEARQWRSRLGVKTGGILVAAVARLAPQKGLDRLIDAAARFVPPRRGRVTVAIGGDGPLRNAIAKRIAELGLEHDVTLLGHVEEGRHLLMAADVVALPSRWESCSYTLLEASAIGRPTVAFEGAQAGPMARVAPQGDINAFADIIGRLIDNPRERDELSQHSRHHVREHHRLDDMIHNTERLYTEGTIS